MTADTTIVGSRVLAGDDVLDDAWVRVRAGRIAEIGTGAPPAGESIDVGGCAIAPGMIDLHVHGGLGHDFHTIGDAAIDELSSHFARHGVTGFLATTHTEPLAGIRAGVERLAVLADRPLPGARMLGINLEGPYLSERCRGAHPRAHLRAPDLGELVDLLDRGPIRVVTIAPELPGAGALVDEVVARGLIASVGHSDASAEQVYAAVDDGARLITHTFNGMSGIHHRGMGVAGAALLDDRVHCELIADGVHVGADALRLAWRLAGRDRIALVTDASAAMGLPEGTEFGWGDHHMRVVGGVTVLDDGTISSSTHALDHGVRTMAAALAVDVLEVWPMASTVPATVLGETACGVLRPGARADLVAVDDGGGIALTMVAGRVVWERR